MLDPEAFSDRAVEIARTKPQFVSQLLRRAVEIGEMTTPPLDLTPHLGDRITRLARRRTHPDPVIGAGKGLGTARCTRQPFLDLVPVDFEVSEHRIGEPAPDCRFPAARLSRRESARIEIETFGQLDQQRGRQGSLIALDQIQIAGRDRQHLGHRGLGKARLAAQTPHRVSGKELPVRHSAHPFDAPAFTGMEQFVNSLQNFRNEPRS
ncbi:hypothetical protein MGWOODY_Smn2222 [hydrothermal vent metagenome]|uniref:Uncharacterized protein n=1 Tax=hydrothermal vent metagenome TaxID=652676 RepID=A0A161KCX7_9ZZZZ